MSKFARLTDKTTGQLRSAELSAGLSAIAVTVFSFVVSSYHIALSDTVHDRVVPKRIT